MPRTADSNMVGNRRHCSDIGTLVRSQSFMMERRREIAMRVFAFVAIFAALVHGATAQSENIKTDPMDVADAENSAESEGLMTLQDFAKHLEAAGYSDVRIVPQTGVVQAKDKVGNPIKMIV